MFCLIFYSANVGNEAAWKRQGTWPWAEFSSFLRTARLFLLAKEAINVYAQFKQLQTIPIMFGVVDFNCKDELEKKKGITAFLLRRKSMEV